MKVIISLISGLIFGLGLIISQMYVPAKVMGFLALPLKDGLAWDPSLAFVMGGGLIVTVWFYQKIIHKFPVPFLTLEYDLPATRPVDWKLILGSLIFGVGWAISGVCPGPALILLALSWQKMILFFVPLIAGMMLARKVKNK